MFAKMVFWTGHTFSDIRYLRWCVSIGVPRYFGFKRNSVAYFE